MNETKEKGETKTMITVTVGTVTYTHTILLVNNKIEINKAKRHKLYAILA